MFLLMVGIQNISHAQESMLMGRVMNKENKAIAGATLTLNVHGETLATISDQNGLYHFSKLVQPGAYLVTIESNNVVSKASCSVIAETEQIKFYNFSLDGSKVLVIVDEHDPFADTYMQTVKSNLTTEDRVPRRHY